MIWPDEELVDHTSVELSTLDRRWQLRVLREMGQYRSILQLYIDSRVLATITSLRHVNYAMLQLITEETMARPWTSIVYGLLPSELVIFAKTNRIHENEIGDIIRAIHDRILHGLWTEKNLEEVEEELALKFPLVVRNYYVARKML